jgi:hypothetical protein
MREIDPAPLCRLALPRAKRHPHGGVSRGVDRAGHLQAPGRKRSIVGTYHETGGHSFRGVGSDNEESMSFGRVDISTFDHGGFHFDGRDLHLGRSRPRLLNSGLVCCP